MSKLVLVNFSSKFNLKDLEGLFIYFNINKLLLLGYITNNLFRLSFFLVLGELELI
jgi:hypothetical protein